MNYVCKGCGEAMPQENFRIHKRGYRIGKCRPCENAYQREWTTRDPQKYRGRKRESMARRRAADIEGARAYRRAYHEANRETRTAKMRDYASRRFFWCKAMKLRGKDRATTKQIASLWKAQKGRCAMTGRRLDRTAQLDHKTPRARGGGDHIANLQWLCAEANLAKRDLSDAEFVELCESVMAWIGRRISAVDDVPC